MKRRSIIILKGVPSSLPDTDGGRVLQFEDFKASLRSGAILRDLLRYNDARLETYRVEVLTRPFITAALIRLLSRGGCRIEDVYGGEIRVTLGELARRLMRAVTDWTRRPRLLKDVASEVLRLGTQPAPPPRLDLAGAPVYLRTDLWFGIESGGSIGHIAGVLNHLGEFTGPPVMLTTDRIPTVDRSIETHIILPQPDYWDFAELPSLAFNATLVSRADAILQGRRLGFVYQRYSTNNFGGIKLASRYRVPLALEYNGSEVWISRHWGRPLHYEGLSRRIELFNLRAADIVVVVSRAMRDELLSRGIDDGKILVNPNGVDPARYSPAIDGSEVRSRLGLGRKTVIGFIGTFGPWHGAEVLADAFARLIRLDRAYRERLRLLMIGDGPRLSACRDALLATGMLDLCVFTGRIPQQDGPAYLAACDILASPHVPNADGSPFFGSPTKLFEYMAMGRGIVASALEQLAEILTHDRTGWLVPPGDAGALAEGLRVLVNDPARRERLGCAARDEVVARYTWKEHTRRIIDKLMERCG
jgi:glycosyltransferase involved in cell wall biosynthesis